MIIEALENDGENLKKYDELAKSAVDFEQSVEKFLTQQGVGFRTQEQLVKEQTEKYGRAKCTPDFVLEHPLEITLQQNGKKISRRVHWIDAKNYTLTRHNFILDSIRKQAQKYNEEFGSGAFLFHYGFVEGVFLPNTIFLDWSSQDG
jgi:hypothetical protein